MTRDCGMGNGTYCGTNVVHLLRWARFHIISGSDTAALCTAGAAPPWVWHWPLCK